MTKEEILAMQPGVELDALVLREVFGCDVEIRSMGWNPDGGPKHCYCHCKDVYDTHTDWENHFGAAISPSTDISAAWQVVERMEGEGWGHKHLRHSTDDPNIYWTFMKPGRGFFIATGTIPEAICKAASLTLCTGGER